MNIGDRIRVAFYICGCQSETRDFTIEKFRHCLGIFKSENDRISGNFTPLCEMFESGPDSKTRYLPNYGEYQTNKVQSWMDIPKD